MKKQYGFCRTALLLCAWLFSSAAYAEIYSGNCGADGANVIWKLDTETGLLEISGTGAMENFYYSDVPWLNYRTSITSVKIDEGVTTIGDYAFAGLNLTSITIPESIISIGDAAFSDCKKLMSVTIPNNVTTINDNAFLGCDALTSVTIGEGVTTIGDYAFAGSNLTSITIPNSVTAIGNRAFASNKLKSFEGKFASKDNRCLVINDTLVSFAPSGLTQYTIPDNVKVIGDYAFYYCEALASVTIPNGVTTISDYVFADCYGLNKVTIPNSVTTIGDWAFDDCYLLRSITIPNSVTTIGENAFDGSGLTSITIPNSVTFIGESAFSLCTDLAEITISNNITTINDGTFYDCSNLRSVTIPESVTSIGNGAFQSCRGLTSVTIGKSVTTIDEYAFDGCSGLTSLTAYNPIPVNLVNEYGYITVFEAVDYETCKLYVPAESVEKYKAAEGWKEFGTISPIDESSAITETRQDKADGHVTVYNLQGVLVLETDDAAALKTLQNGAYIVNGKKMIIAQ